MQTHKYAQYFPPLEGEEFDQLVADIKTHGLREPIVTFEGKILDGRNRYRACQRAGIEPRFQEFRDGGDTAALEYVVSMNLRRRDLTPTQKGTIGFDILPEFTRLAAERMKAGGDRGLAVTAGKADRREAPGQKRTAAADAAKAVGVAPRTIERVERVRKHAPELVPKMRTGEITATEAEEQVRARLARQAVKRQQDKTDQKKRDDPREVKKHLEAIRAFADQLREAVKIASYGKFSPEAQRFIRRWYDSIRTLMDQVEAHFNG